MIRSATLGWPAFWMIGVISIGCLFPFLVIVGNSLSASGGEDADLIGVSGKLMTDARFWLALLCAIVAALLPDVLSAAVRRLCAPRDYQILQVCVLLRSVARLGSCKLCCDDRAPLAPSTPTWTGRVREFAGSGCSAAQRGNGAAACWWRRQQRRGSRGCSCRRAPVTSRSSWPAAAGPAACLRVIHTLYTLAIHRLAFDQRFEFCPHPQPMASVW